MIPSLRLGIAITPILSIALALILKTPGFESTNLLFSLLLMVWMVTWWIFEIIPLGITALIPLVYLPLFGLSSIEKVSALYGSPVIYLFLGGFMIAKAMEKTQLDERMALWTLMKLGRTDRGILQAFIIITAFLSFWISNTATAMMMVPIALSVVQFLKNHICSEQQLDLRSLQVALFLSIAYAANIGGVVTPIGSPPNVVFVGYLESLYGQKIDFWRWMAVGLPVALASLILMYLLLIKLHPFHLDLPSGFGGYVKDQFQKLGRLNSGQKRTVQIFLLATFLWIFKDVIHWLLGLEFLNDTSIAVLAGVLLFLIPMNTKGERVLTSSDISQLPWEIVLLFGGGLALAGSLKEVGFVEITTRFFAQLPLPHSYWLIFLLTLSALFMTEIMSNVALVVVALPMIMKLGESQGIAPILIGLPITFAASYAFMLPISTPPNAIVFSAKTMSLKDMIRMGFWMNLGCFIITLTLGYYLIRFFLFI